MTERKDLRKRATYDDLLKVPDHLVAEIIDGVLYTSPRPATPHLNASSLLLLNLGPCQQHFGTIGGWWLLMEPELHFDDDVLVPDIAGWRVEQTPEIAEAAFITQPPDWLCETLSPSTASLDRKKKLPVYARAGVTHVWFLNPKTRTLDVLTREGLGWTVHATFGARDLVCAVPFDTIEFELSHFWTMTTAGSAQAGA